MQALPENPGPVLERPAAFPSLYKAIRSTEFLKNQYIYTFHLRDKKALIIIGEYGFGEQMPRPRTRKLSKSEMSIWISGYNKGLQAGLAALERALATVRKEQKINARDEKDVARKFK